MTDTPTTDRGDPVSGALVAACEQAWADIKAHHPELPNAVIVLGSGMKRGRLVKLGHRWQSQWIADGQARAESSSPVKPCTFPPTTSPRSSCTRPPPPLDFLYTRVRPMDFGPSGR